MQRAFETLSKAVSVLEYRRYYTSEVIEMRTSIDRTIPQMIELTFLRMNNPTLQQTHKIGFHSTSTLCLSVLWQLHVYDAGQKNLRDRSLILHCNPLHSSVCTYLHKP